MRVVALRLAGILILITVAETSLSWSCAFHLRFTNWVNGTELENFSQLVLEEICPAGRVVWLGDEGACPLPGTHMMEGENKLPQVFCDFHRAALPNSKQTNK